MEFSHGICNLSVVPCRSEPSDKSEMITQLLFGEFFSILKQTGNWVYIRSGVDSYEGWIDIKQFQPISSETYDELEQTEFVCSTDSISVIENVEKGSFFPIVMGSILPYYDGLNCNLEGYEYAYEGRTSKSSPSNKAECMVEHAYAYLNAPYLWGGKSPLGIDCSGFTQMVARTAGVKLMRDAYQQAEQGVTLGFIEEANTGDLVFFDNEEGRIIHVGVLLNSQEIIHASGKVRIDKIDHQGIYNQELGKYTHNLRLIKRIL